MQDGFTANKRGVIAKNTGHQKNDSTKRHIKIQKLLALMNQIKNFQISSASPKLG
jgi:hypothetical protein